ncbi:MAG: Ig-like domain-containing protein [Bdellovibrionia bacterium]
MTITRRNLVFLFGLSLFWQTPSFALTVTRVPYLQLGTPESVVVKWRTDTSSDSYVMFGTSLTALNKSVTVPQSTTRHEVKITGLLPDTTYYYAVGSSSTILEGKDAEHSFQTSPTPGSTKPFQIWVLGDPGAQTSTQLKVRDAYYKYAGSNRTHGWLFLGDNAYDSGTDSEYQKGVFDVYQKMFRGSVLWPSRGNHDMDLNVYKEIFTLPTQGEAGGTPSGTESYYSFDYGNAHFICLDSYATDRSATGRMATWLKADLSNTRQNWIIGFWHHAPYSKGSHDSDTEEELIEMRTNIIPIFEAGGADLILNGHSHAYERSYFIDGHYNVSSTFKASMKKDNGNGRETGTGVYKKTNQVGAPHQGTVYVVAGNAGEVTGGPFGHPAMITSLEKFGSLVLNINNNRLDLKFLRETGALDDQFTIVKGGGDSDTIAPTIVITSPKAGTTITENQVSLTVDASDNIGVAKVEFYDQTTQIGSDTTAPFSIQWDTQKVANGTHQLIAKAYDAAGNTTSSVPVSVKIEHPASSPTPSPSPTSTPKPTPTPTPTSPPDTEQIIFKATADAYVESSTPDKNLGKKETLRTDASPKSESYIRFEVTKIPPVIKNVVLRLYATDSTESGPLLYVTTSDWKEYKVTWKNRPKALGSRLGKLGKIDGTPISVDFEITSSIKSTGVYNFLLKSDSSDRAVFSSREGSNGPQLIINPQ